MDAKQARWVMSTARRMAEHKTCSRSRDARSEVLGSMLLGAVMADRGYDESLGGFEAHMVARMRSEATRAIHHHVTYGMGIGEAPAPSVVRLGGYSLDPVMSHILEQVTVEPGHRDVFLVQRMRRAMSILSPAAKNILVQCVVLEVGVSEVAKKMGISRQRVEKQLREAKAQLRVWFEKEDQWQCKVSAFRQRRRVA